MKDYIFRVLIAIDQLFNVVLFNGIPDETISGNIGYKILNGKANKFEKSICWVLRKIENKHCIKSIDHQEYDNKKGDY